MSNSAFQLNMNVVIDPYLARKLGLRLDQIVKEDFVDTAIEIAKAKSPYLTGNNRRKIKSQKIPRASGWWIGSKSGYGGYLEFGTSTMPARPYFFPALYEAMDVMRRKYGAKKGYVT